MGARVRLGVGVGVVVGIVMIVRLEIAIIMRVRMNVIVMARSFVSSRHDPGDEENKQWALYVGKQQRIIW